MITTQTTQRNNIPLITLEPDDKSRLRNIKFSVSPDNLFTTFLWRWLRLRTQCSWYEEPIEEVANEQ